MKFDATIAVLAIAIGAAHCLPVNNGLPTPQQTKELIEAALRYVESNIPKSHQMPLPDVINQHLTVSDIDTDVFVSKRNEMAYGVNKILFDEYKFNPSTSSTKFRLTAPNVTEIFDYEVEGKIFGLNVSGEGVMKTETIGIGYVVTDLRFEEINRSLQISALELSFVLDNVAIKIEGLHIDEISVRQLEKLLEIYVLTKARETRDELSKGFADEMKKNINKMISGHSTDQVIDWLKQHTNQEINNDFIENVVTRFVKVL